VDRDTNQLPLATIVSLMLGEENGKKEVWDMTEEKGYFRNYRKIYFKFS
jgi:hypothetical protein